MKIANALGTGINVFMDFDIEMVSDVLSLLLKMDEKLDMDFETERYKNGSGCIHESNGIAGEPFK